MSELYQVLGVRFGAADQEIRAAFRSLAKKLHPDLNPGDADAERRLRDALNAYETLSNPASRMAYDAGLAHQRSLRRRRLRAKAMTMLTVFALTVTIGLSWRGLNHALRLAGGYPAPITDDTKAAAIPPQALSPLAAGKGGDTGMDERPKAEAKPSSATATPLPPPKMPADITAPHLEAKVDPTSKSYGLGLDDPVEPSDKVVSALRSKRPDAEVATDREGVYSTQASAPAAMLSAVPRKAGHWTTYDDNRFGFTLEYPEDVFAPDQSRPDEGKSFLSRDGRARLLISASLTKGVALATHRQSLMEGVYGGAAFDYTPHRTTWYVLSGTLGTQMFYQRVTFSCDGRAYHTWMLVYPLSEREYYDRIVEGMHGRYRHSKVPGGGCG